uniref:Uncharacterized protein n=1 Tax=Trypanosoma vivax (strain Y486) TaxID=1055687 RepID=G0U6U1_TRYVY|nr:hypothetical protein, unlikely [Trypanosoma vivax Y486]
MVTVFKCPSSGYETRRYGYTHERAERTPHFLMRHSLMHINSCATPTGKVIHFVNRTSTTTHPLLICQCAHSRTHTLAAFMCKSPWPQMPRFLNAMVKLSAKVVGYP